MHTREEKLEAFGRLMDVVDRLRVECPWDRKQTYDTLRTQTIEEVYELCDALINHDEKNIGKEAGDLLLHVLFYAKIGSENGTFDMADVANQEADKLIFRHPHIYGNVEAQTADDVLQNWEQIKLQEKDGNKTVLGGVPKTLPALVKAMRIQDKARNSGFDWDERSQVWDKVKEEIQEFEVEARKMPVDENGKIHPTPAMEDEFGDVLFSLVNAARLYKINPENALEHTNQKFISRFNYVEQKAKEAGKALNDCTLAEMDAWWNEAKTK